MHVSLRLAAAAVLCVPLAAASLSPAEAGVRWTFRSSELSAQVQIVVLGAMDGHPGNAHTGTLYASRGGFVGGYITDWTCDEGEYPPYPGGGGAEDEPEPEPACTHEGFTEYFAEGTAAVQIDRKLSSASMVGTLDAFQFEEEQGGKVGTVEIDLELAALGGSVTETTYVKDGSYVLRNTTTTRNASVTGEFAGLTLGGDTAWGQLRSQKTYERYASK